MKLNNVKVEILQGTQWVEYEIINGATFTQSINLFEGKTTDSFYSVRFKYNSNLYNYLIANKNVRCCITLNDLDSFTGIIENKFNVKRTNLPPSEISVNVVSLTFLLRKKYKIIKKYNNKSTAYIVADLLSLANLSIDSYPQIFSDTVLTRTFDLSKKTPLEIIETLCFELGYTFFADSALKINLKSIKQTLPVDFTLNENQILDKVSLSVSDKQADEVDVKYFELQTFSEMICFEDVSNQNTMYRCNIVLAPGAYYQDNEAGVYLDLIYTKDGKSFDIFNITSATLDIIKDSGIEILEQYLTDDNRYFVKIKNNGATAQHIYKLQVKCEGQIKTSISLKKNSFGSGDIIKSYEMQYIQSSVRASALVEALAQLYKHSNYIVEFSSYINFGLFSKIKLNNVYGIGTVYCCLTKKSFSLNLNMNCVFEYTAVVINEIEQFEIETEQTIPSNPTNLDIINNPQVPTTDTVLMGEEGTESIVFTDEDDDEVILRLAQETTDKGKYLAIQKLYKDGLLFKDYGNLRLKKIMLEELEVQGVLTDNISTSMLEIRDSEGNLSSINVNALYINSLAAMLYSTPDGKVVLDNNVYQKAYNAVQGSKTNGSILNFLDQPFPLVYFGNYVVFRQGTKNIKYYSKTDNTFSLTNVSVGTISGNSNNIISDIIVFGSYLYVVISQYDQTYQNYDHPNIYRTSNLTSWTLVQTLNLDAGTTQYAKLAGKFFIYAGTLYCSCYDVNLYYKNTYIYKPLESPTAIKIIYNYSYDCMAQCLNTSYLLAISNYTKRIYVVKASDWTVYTSFSLPANINHDKFNETNLICLNPSATSYQIFYTPVFRYYQGSKKLAFILQITVVSLSSVFFDWIPVATGAEQADSTSSFYFSGICQPMLGEKDASDVITRYNISQYIDYNQIITNIFSTSSTINACAVNSSLTIDLFTTSGKTTISEITSVVKANVFYTPQRNKYVIVAQKTNQKIKIYVYGSSIDLTYGTEFTCNYGYTAVQTKNYIIIQMLNSDFSPSNSLILLDISDAENGNLSHKLLGVSEQQQIVSAAEISKSNYINLVVFDYINDKYLQLLFNIPNKTFVVIKDLTPVDSKNILSQTNTYKSSNTMILLERRYYTLGNWTISEIVQQLGAGIVVKDSNSNGHYVRFGYDGTKGLQICWNKQIRNDIACSNAYGSLYEGIKAITFPASFSSSYPIAVHVGTFRWSTGASWGLSTNVSSTGFTARIIDAFSRASGTDTDLAWIAIGYYTI